MSIIKAQTASLLAIALGCGLVAPAFATTPDTETSADISAASMAAAEDSNNAADEAVDSNDEATMDDTMAPEDEDNAEDTMDEEDTTPTAE